MAGVRSGKTVTTTDASTGETTTTHYKYITLSGKLTRLEYNDREIDFIYDEDGRPYAMVYESSTKPKCVYYYILNVQGDVVALMNEAGNVVADYTYDEWGKLISVTGSNTTMGNITPLRYRGYIYDRDTGLYYLQSRYYDPAIGRFINADAFASTDTKDLLGTNMFAYCENNPVNMVDPNGCDPIPSWAKRIIDGNATEADYKKALSVNSEGWGGHARYYVDKAVGLAKEYCQKTGKTGVRVERFSSVFGMPIAFEGAVGIATDKFGNQAIVITAGGGGGACMTSIKYNDAGLGGGASEYKDAIMVWDIAGVGTNMGATIGPLSYGIAICDATKAEACGFSLGWGMEIHAVVDYTWLIPLNY